MPPDLGRDLIVRWPAPAPADVPLLKEAGIQAVVTAPNEAFEAACRQSNIAVIPEAGIRGAKADSLPDSPGSTLIFEGGLWPGISRGAATGWDENTASASRDPWVDSNTFWVEWMRALRPKATPVLAYQAGEAAGLKPDRMVPFDSAEMAIAESRVAGGNTIVPIDPQFRKALVEGNAKAKAAWAQFAATARWLGANRSQFGALPHPYITALVEPGEETAELANMMYRRNASPRLAPASAPPPPSRDICVLSATGVAAPPPSIAEHAKQGAIVVTDDPGENAWWRRFVGQPSKQQEDRTFYPCGKGNIVVYKEKVVDPSEYALDLIDLLTHPKRGVRVWNASSLIGIACPGALQLLNYSRPTDGQTQVRVQGRYQSATLLRPESAPLKLEIAHRGTTTEFYLPEVRHVASVTLR